MTLEAGACALDISPIDSQFLYGYPHVERYSEGIHDPLLASALCLRNGSETLLFLAADILWFNKETATRIRGRIAEAAGIPPSHIMLAATHTHSGPNTVDWLAARADAIVPPADPAYLELFENGMADAGIGAAHALQPARVGLALADGTGIGTNRHDPKGPHDPDVPVLLAESLGDGEPIGAMMLYSMHPTVLHEDSRLVSGDFPAMARQYLQEHFLGESCPVLYLTGPAGNQSPRHTTRANTFDEARRLGEILGQRVLGSLADIQWHEALDLHAAQGFLELPARAFPPVEEAQAELDEARAAFRRLCDEGAPAQEVRTAECAVFGAEEKVTLAQAAASGELDAVRKACLPAEVQVLRLGPWAIAGWQGEVFVEYGLAAKAACPGVFVASYANGELQGYIVTPEAAAARTYEAGNALFEPRSGDMMVEETVRLVRAMRESRGA